MALRGWRSRDGLTLAQVRRRYARIAAAVLAGVPIKRVAESHGATESVGRRACRRAGLMLGPHGTAGTRARQAQRRRMIVRAVRGGMTPREAMQRFGVSHSTVCLACREAGVCAPRSPGGQHLASLRARKVLAKRLPRGHARELGPCATRILRLLLRTDLSYDEIGARCGVTRQRVGQVFAAAKKAAEDESRSHQLPGRHGS